MFCSRERIAHYLSSGPNLRGCGLAKFRSSSSHFFTIPEFTNFFHEIFFSFFFFKVEYLVRDINSPNNQSCFPQFFPRIFLSMSSSKRKQTFHLSKTEKKTCFGPIRSLFAAQTEKKSWKKLGKT